MDSLERAELLINQKRYDMAEEHLNKVLAESPNHALATAYKALIKLQTRQSKEALTIAQAALGLDPKSDFALYIMAAAYIDINDLKNAEKAIVQAISFQPYHADYYGVHANIKLITKDYRDAKKIAEQGLEVDPENLLCRNILSTAWLKLGSKAESFNTIEKALEMDPNNPMTHANIGWGELEKGSHKKALEHFKEALSKNPENEYSRAGMLEALKAKFFLYRIFLKYYFFMGNLKPGVQWGVIIGIVLIQRALGSGTEQFENLAFILEPLTYLLILFAVSTWVVHPIFNFFMSLNSYAKFLLTPEDKRTSYGVGACFILFAVSVVGWLITRSDGFLAGALVGFTLILPVGRILASRTSWVRIVTALYSLITAMFGTLLILGAFIEEHGIYNGWLTFYAIAIVAFSWVWNFIGNR
ncbi:MAG: tetratricopeptide repeat protein [Roseivirga sp.]|nr:tetratricopeptide repeat protein [Roseivirga sp.]